MHRTEEEYEHARKVWEECGCKTLGDYYNLYVETDAALLADVFENFRTLCHNRYGLDPVHYYTTSGLAWDALLKKSGAELELLMDYEKHLFLERGMRGGISRVSTKRYTRANNPSLEGYDPSKREKHIMYYDTNNLYGWALVKPLLIRDFKWKRVMPTEVQIMKKKEDSKCGWILEVDLEYPAELHKEHSAYPMAPEKQWKKSGYQSTRKILWDS